MKRGRIIVGGGYRVHYNGLALRILWWERGKDLEKVVAIDDRDEQLKKIREFWKARYREHPEEFMAKKVAK